MPQTLIATALLSAIWLSAIITLTVKVVIPQARKQKGETKQLDYTTIASIELEIYGETYLHDGAPQSMPTPDRPSADEALDRAESRRSSRYEFIGKSSPSKGSVHPSATLDQYVIWLKGYIKRGGKPTVFLNHPFSTASFEYADHSVIVNSDREYGARSRKIIVEKNVRVWRTNPNAYFSGWGHTKLYLMDGYQVLSGTSLYVPIYSDPEFDDIRAHMHT